MLNIYTLRARLSPNPPLWKVPYKALSLSLSLSLPPYLPPSLRLQTSSKRGNHSKFLDPRTIFFRATNQWTMMMSFIFSFRNKIIIKPHTLSGFLPLVKKEI